MSSKGGTYQNTSFIVYLVKLCIYLYRIIVGGETMKTWLKILVSLGLIISVCACSNSVETSHTYESVDDISNHFNWDLYTNLSIKRNHFYSAYGILSALMMADNGAEGAARKELESALGIKDRDAFNKAYKKLREALIADNFINASALFMKDSIDVSDKYEDLIKKYYDADTKKVDFSNINKVRELIRKWVDEKTNHFIKDYKSSVDQESVGSLLNTIYYKGEWEEPFIANDTYEEDFHEGKNTYKVEMMHKFDEKIQYYSNDTLKGINLPYKDDKVMTVIMPRDDTHISKIWEKMSYQDKTDFIKQIDDSDLTKLYKLGLCKLDEQMSYDNLLDKLNTLGIKTLFTDQADLSHISKDIMFSDISHIGKIKVDEKGTEAAAVTEIIVKSTAIPQQEKTTFITDHPYIYMIRDKNTGIILFTGEVNTLK